MKGKRMSISRDDLAQSISKESGHPPQMVKEVLKLFVKHLQNNLVKGKEVQLRGLFRLRRLITPERYQNTPNFKGVIPEHGRVEVRIHSSLRKLVR